MVIDLLSIMLLDQGWFDTRPDVIGLIGDPLTPVTVTQAVIKAQILTKSIIKAQILKVR